jgi:hypothetical protein
MASRYQTLLQQLRSKQYAPSKAVSAQTTPAKPLGGTGVLGVGGNTASPSAGASALPAAGAAYQAAGTPLWSGDPTMITSPINPGPYAAATAMPPPSQPMQPAPGAPVYPVAAAAQGVPPPGSAPASTGSGGGTFPGGGGATSGTGGSSGGGGGFPGGGGGGTVPVGGGSSSTTGPFYQPGGAAGGYLGDVGAGYIFSNPESMLANQLGGASGGLYNMLAPLAGLANPYYMLMNPMGGTNTNAQGLNFMDQFWSGAQQTGNFFNYDALMGSLMNPEGWLKAYLGDQYNDPAAQAQAFGQMYEAVVRGTQHPLFAKAMMGALDNTESEYLGKAAMGNITPYGQYVAGALPNL